MDLMLTTDGLSITIEGVCYVVTEETNGFADPTAKSARTKPNEVATSNLLDGSQAKASNDL